jgi:hypothetical protein
MTGRPFETLFALSIGIQVADALSVAHAAVKHAEEVWLALAADAELLGLEV